MNFVHWQEKLNETEAGYRLWISDDKTTLVRFWNTGITEVAFRESAAHTWGPPIEVTEEQLEPSRPTESERNEPHPIEPHPEQGQRGEPDPDATRSD